MPEDRRLAAIMFTDIVGYTTLMGEDEKRAFETLRQNREIHNDCIKKHNGTLIKEIGDGTLISFGLASDAVRCAVDIQAEAVIQKIPIRIGIHQGEMVFEGTDVFGDGVNIASRLQELTEERGISISGTVYQDVKNKSDIHAEFQEEVTLKNVVEPIKVYKVITEQELRVTSNQPPSTRKDKRYYYMIGGILILIAVFLFWKYFLDSKPSTQDAQLSRSIAVKPFFNESADEENTYFVNGMMEDIRNNLSKVGELRVASRTSTEKYRETNLSAKEIARELNVRYLLEGSVQKLGNQVKIHAQLIDPEIDDHIWSETYVRDISEVFKVQSEIAQEISQALKAAISPEEKDRIETVPTKNLEAYEYYLKGNEYRWELDQIDTAILFFQKAIALDPDFAQAYLKLGESYHDKTYWSEYFQDTFADSLIVYANKALEINPYLADGYALKGYYHYLKSDFNESIEQYEKAIELNPIYGKYYRMLGENYKALGDYYFSLSNYEKAERLLRNEPDEYFELLQDLVTYYYFICDFEKCKKYIKEIFDYDSALAYIYTAWIHYLKGEWDMMEFYSGKSCEIDSGRMCFTGLAWSNIGMAEFSKALFYLDKLREVVSETGEPLLMSEARYAYTLNNLGREEEAMKHIDLQIEYCEERIRLRREDATISGEAQSELVQTYAYLGEKEKAYEFLYELEDMEFSAWHFLFTKVNPLVKNLWEDEEYQQIIERQEKKYAEIRAQVDIWED
ncbi:adenylate/guanylate cyclase domain-containing protein [Bacteroidota bacterium]